MCGISCFFARESVIDYKHLDTLFKWGEKRGTDGFGVVIVPRKNNHEMYNYISLKSYSECKNEVEQFIKDHHYGIGSLIMAINRAQPESEPPSTCIQNMQPIINNNCVLIHNGAVSNKIHRELQKWAKDTNEYVFIGDNDSESILAAYIKYQKNLVDAMQYLSGGFAFLLYDKSMDRIFMTLDFKPLCWGYIRGKGLLISSMIDPIEEITYDITNCPRCGMAIWEDFYFHPISGPRIQEIDLQSGFVRKIKYSPRFIVGNTFDSNSEILKEN